MVLAASVLSIVEFLAYPLVKCADPTLALFHYWTSAASAAIIRLFVRVEAVGAAEHLRALAAGPHVIVCNHQSDIDNNIVSCVLGRVNFKVIIKRELLLYPGIGCAFYMVGHIPIDRKSKESGRAGLDGLRRFLRLGAHAFLFPEGTRHNTGEAGPIGPLKPGAFKLAVDAGVPVLPVTISGARGVMPPSGLRLGFGTVRVTVHAPVPSAGKTVDALSQEVRAVMMQDMRDVDAVEIRPGRKRAE